MLGPTGGHLDTSGPSWRAARGGNVPTWPLEQVPSLALVRTELSKKIV